MLVQPASLSGRWVAHHRDERTVTRLPWSCGGPAITWRDSTRENPNAAKRAEMTARSLGRCRVVVMVVGQPRRVGIFTVGKRLFSIVVVLGGGGLLQKAARSRSALLIWGRRRAWCRNTWRQGIPQLHPFVAFCMWQSTATPCQTERREHGSSAGRRGALVLVETTGKR